MNNVTMKMSDGMRILLCCAMCCLFTIDAAAGLVIEDGSGTSAGGEWTLENAQAISVRSDGAGGDVKSHENYGDSGFATFWHEGLASPNGNTWTYPTYKRTDFAGDLSAYMNGSVKLSMRNINWVQLNSSFAYTNNIQFIFDGTVGGASKLTAFQLYVDPYAVAAYGWTQGVWHDVEVNLEDGLFTMAGSTYPMDTHPSLQINQYSVTAENALEFWQNITGVRVYMQVKDPGGNQYDTWMDISNLEFVPEPATMVLLGLGGLLLRRKR